MGLFSRLFARAPRYHESAYGGVYSAVKSRLTRAGVTVGKTARVPRVEIHSITEGERLDKDGLVRQLTLTVESIGNASLPATVEMNEKNIELLTEELVLGEGWRCFGVIPDQLQDLTESSDTNKILYRLMQTFTVWVERVKDDTDEEVDDAGDPADPEDPLLPDPPEQEVDPDPETEDND